jgi:hypothetical protein
MRRDVVAAGFCIGIAFFLAGCESESLPVDPARSSVTVDRTSDAVADGTDAITLSVTLRDASGEPLDGRSVAVQGPVDVKVGPIGATNQRGTTTATLTSTVAGMKRIEVTVEDLVLDPIDVAFLPGAAAGLAFVGQPTTGEIGSVLPKIEVAFVDAFDNVVFGETGTITVSLLPNSEGAVASGPDSVDAVDGVATFSALYVDRVASNLVLRATSSTTAARDSDPFDVGYGEPASASTLTAAPGTSAADGVSPIELVVTLRNAAGIAIPDYPVTLAASGSGTAFFPSAAGATDSQGRLSTALTSTAVGMPTVTATAGAFVLSATVSFTQPACIPQLPGSPSAIVGPTSPYPTTAWSVLVADFNSDGHSDAAVVHRTVAMDEVSILRGAGNGRFHPPTYYYIGPDISGLAAGDLDTDGDIDLAFSGRGDRKVFVLLNAGTGQFTPGTPTSFPGTVYDVEVVDFNADTKPDLVARADYIVMTALGNGNGTFQAPVQYVTDSPPYSAGLASIDVAKLDGNSTYDIISTANGYYTVLLGNPNGTFTALPSVQGAPENDSIAIGDYDGDTVTDVVIAPYYFRGNGNGTFASPTFVPVQTYAGARAARAADLDGDSKLDLIASASNVSDRGLRVLRGNGDGTFAPPQIVVLSRGADSVGIGDFDEDGKLDVLVAQSGIHSSINVLRGTGTGTVIGGGRFFGDTTGSGRAFFWPVTGDFDNNGTLDFFAMNDVYETWGLHMAASDGSLTAMPTQNLASVSDAVAGDCNSDGKLDVLTLGTGLTCSRGNGDGTLQAPTTSTMPLGWAVSLRVAKLDTGNTDDAVFVNPLDNKVTVTFGTGATTWTGPVQYTVPAEPVAVEVMDVDGDSDRDLIVASRSGKAVTVLTNNGSGAFTAAPSLSSAGSPASLVVGDIDEDGVADILVGDYDLNTIGFYKGNSNGSFAAEVRMQLGVISPQLALRDLDGDGDRDLLVLARGLYVFRGAAGATFKPPLLYDIGLSDGPVLADFNSDGQLDMMTSQRSGPDAGFAIAYGKGCL